MDTVDGFDGIWIEKYRPKSFGDVISHDHIISTISRLMDADRLPHLLFYGPPGTGKTSTIIACARQLYGPKYKSHILELNASDDRGIDVVRNQIKDFAGTRQIFSKGLKLIVLDEADSMTKDAQAALRRTIERYTSNTRFCLICNYVNKIIPALQSRCTRFRFSPLNLEQIQPRLDDIIQQENVNITDDGRKAILDLSGGDMRKVLNILQAAHMAYDVVNANNVYSCTGNPLPSDIRELVSWMLNDSFKNAFDKIAKLKTEKGLALQDILREVHLYALRLELPDIVQAELIHCLAEVDYRLSAGTDEELQLASMVGALQKARDNVSMDVEQDNSQ